MRKLIFALTTLIFLQALPGHASNADAPTEASTEALFDANPPPSTVPQTSTPDLSPNLPKDSAIHTFGGGELFERVFNAIAMLVYGNTKSGLAKTFNAMIKLAIAIGSFCSIYAAFSKESIVPIFNSFFFPSLAISTLLIVPRTTVYIYDHLASKTSSAHTQVLRKVDNVPYSMGMIATMMSTLSYYITSSLEEVSHGVNDATYNWTGHIYADDNLLQARKNRLTDKVLEDNFREFCRQCVWRDIGLGLYSKDDLATSKDLLTFLKKNTSRIRTVFYRETQEKGEKTSAASTSSKALPCRDVIKKIHADLKKSPANSKELLFGELGTEFGYLLDKSKKTSGEINNLIKQQVAIDLLKEEMPGTLQSFAVQRAEIQQKENQKILGALGAKSIVAMRNFFEALVYMVFPLIILTALASFGISALSNWIQFVLWINLWPPFYVVVNFLLNSIWHFERQHKFGDSIHLTLATSEGLLDLYSTMESIAFVALAFVPYLSWVLMRGGVSQMVHLASSLMSPAQTAASTAAAESTTGSYSFGNVSLANSSGYNHDAFRQTFSGQFTRGSVSLDQGSGSVTYATDSDTAYLRQADSHLREGIAKTAAFNHSIQDQKASADSVVQERSEAASTSINETAHYAAGFVKALSENDQIGNSANIQNLSNEQQTAHKLTSIAEEYANMSNISKDQAVREMVEGGISTGALGMLGIKGGAQASYQDGVSESEGQSNSKRGALTHQFMEQLHKTTQWSDSASMSLLNSQDKRAHQDFTESLNKTQSHMEQLRAAQSHQESLSNLESYAQSDSLSVQKNLNQGFVDFVRAENDGDMGAVARILDQPSEAPEKRGAIDRFIGEHLPKQLATKDLEAVYAEAIPSKEALHHVSTKLEQGSHLAANNPMKRTSSKQFDNDLGDIKNRAKAGQTEVGSIIEAGKAFVGNSKKYVEQESVEAVKQTSIVKHATRNMPGVTALTGLAGVGAGELLSMRKASNVAKDEEDSSQREGWSAINKSANQSGVHWYRDVGEKK